MIGWLRGRVIGRQAPYLLLEVNGVGYELEATMTTFYDLPPLGAEHSIYTHLIVRDDAHLLYGFACESERAMFRRLIKVNGVGAKLALSILSGISVADFTCCVRENDSLTLTRLPGVGKKTAARLIIEMRDCLDEQMMGSALMSAAGAAGGDAASRDDPVGDAISALTALGYKAHEASRMVRALDATDRNSEELIRSALQAVVK